MLFPNEGWETGDFDGWVSSGTGAKPSILPAGIYYGLPWTPRTGSYGCRFVTPLGTSQWGRAKYTITDTAHLVRLAGRTITFKVWTWCQLITPNPDTDNQRRIIVGDNVGSSYTDLPKTPYQTWQQSEVSHAIDSAPTQIFFEIYYLKGGARAMYLIFIDDMESDPVSLLPTVTTDPATEVEGASATGNGNITDNGGEDCDKRGFVYNTSPHGDPGDTAPADSEYSNYVEETNSFGTGAFTGALTSLDPTTAYYVRAYAHNSAGYSYGNEVEFTTLLALPTVTTDAATGRGLIVATINGTLNQDGGEACECGFEWGADITYGARTPTETKVTGETFSQRILGLFPGTEYHYRAFGTNSVGTSYGADESFRSEPSFSRAYALAREEL